MLCNLFVAESLTEKRTRATDLQTVSPSHVSLTVNILLFSFFELGAWMTSPKHISILLVTSPDLNVSFNDNTEDYCEDFLKGLSVW